MLKNAIAIPLAGLRDRVSEIPNDKTVIFQCNTGTQAEIAYNMFKDLGYTNVKYLNAKMKFGKDGSYTLSTD